jgi:hypothetical protein
MTRALVAAVACVTAACGAPLMKLPAGPGTPAGDAAEAFTQATAACRRIRTLTAEIGLTGSVGGRRTRGRLLAGVAAPASVRLEAVAPFGAPVFIFVADNDEATLLLPRDDLVLEGGRPAAVLDAVAGVPLDAADLHTTLTGCAPAIPPAEGRALGTDWRLVAGSVDGIVYNVYLRRDGGGRPWRLAAILRDGAGTTAWRADYTDYLNNLPRSIHITSGAADPPGAVAFDLTLALAQVETNVALGPEAFRVDIPSSADPITLDELRRARPGLRED